MQQLGTTKCVPRRGPHPNVRSQNFVYIQFRLFLVKLDKTVFYCIRESKRVFEMSREKQWLPQQDFNCVILENILGVRRFKLDKGEVSRLVSDPDTNFNLSTSCDTD